MAQTKDKVIGIILKGFPRLSETFIVNEILLLEAMGYQLHIFAPRNTGEGKIHEKDIYLEDHDLLREKIWRAKFIVAGTAFNRDYLLHLAGKDAAVFCSYHGVDLKAFKPVPSRPFNNSCPVIVSIGRFVPKKGFAALLHALHLLKQEQVQFHCYIIGGGPQQSELEKLVADLGLSNCVEIMPPMPRASLLLYYRQADIFALA